MTPLLVASDIRDGHGRTPVLHGVSLRLDAGELVGLVGPNAAGKSTLLRVLAGERLPAAGSVRLGGDDVRALSGRERAGRLAFVPQSVRDDVEFTAAEMVALSRTTRLGGWTLDTAALAPAVTAALEAADASALAHRPFRNLSGGERQRVLFARALAQDARVWLLDEPTAHLDLSHQWLVVEEARGHAGGGGAVLWVLHDLALAAQLPRVIVLDAGRIVADGPPADVLTPALLATVWKVRARWIDGSPRLLAVDGRSAPTADPARD